MNLALLHYSIPPIVGGVESVIAHQARLFAAHGHRVRLIAARGAALGDDLPLVTVPLADSQAPRILAMKQALDAGGVPPDFANVRDALADDLRAALAGVEVLLAHNVCSLNKNLALTAALHQLHGTPGFPRLILWHHDLAWTTPRYRAELHAGHPWDLLRTRWAGATQVVVSAWRRQELADLWQIDPASIHVIPNGVELATFLKLEPRTLDLLAQLPLRAAAPLLLLPVRLTPRKNIELALRVLAELRRAWPDAQLVITGPEGPHNPANAAYKQALFALRAALHLHGQAHFLAEITPEFLSDAVIADFYRLADALILPSREEGFGIPLIEAGVAHLPVFCADLPVLRELGGDAVTYFAPDADPVTVARLIAEALQANPAYQWAYRARRGYAWESIYTQHLEPLLQEAFA